MKKLKEELRDIPIESLLFFENVREDALVQKAVQLYRMRTDIQSYEIGEAKVYGEIKRLFVGSFSTYELPTTWWKNHIVNLVAQSENLFTEISDLGRFDENIWLLAEGDLEILRNLYSVDWDEICEGLEEQGFAETTRTRVDSKEDSANVENSMNGDKETDLAIFSKLLQSNAERQIQPGEDGNSSAKAPSSSGKIKQQLELSELLEKSALGERSRQACVDAEASPGEGSVSGIRALASYYQKNGRGIFQAYDAFHWEGEPVPVKNPDPTTFETLVGYEDQKAALIENTEFFLSGAGANNVLLYGDRGTGKSSSVKALLNHFPDRKLKMISIPKSQIGDFRKISEIVENSGCYFILFIDDLSFEEVESDYRSFKSAMEGSLALQPSNLLVYATSNRRKLVKETWGDRQQEGNEISLKDGIEEKLSLVDRFGLLISYQRPDQEEYLAIVEGLAQQEGVLIKESDLKEAMRWELRNNGRSGRTAKQFITDLKARR